MSAGDAGYDWRWTKLAEQIRKRDGYLCQECLRTGGMALAMAELQSRPTNGDGSTRRPPVDHIIPAHARPDLFFVASNLQTLCTRHNAEKAIQDAKTYGTANR